MSRGHQHTHGCGLLQKLEMEENNGEKVEGRSSTVLSMPQE